MFNKYRKCFRNQYIKTIPKNTTELYYASAI